MLQLGYSCYSRAKIRMLNSTAKHPSMKFCDLSVCLPAHERCEIILQAALDDRACCPH